MREKEEFGVVGEIQTLLTHYTIDYTPECITLMATANRCHGWLN